jgi:hypothetical protein
MPWTFAHPAAVLPLRKLANAACLSFPALLIGCITPDVVYHLGRWDWGRLTHSPIGLLLVDVPIGVCLLWCGSTLQAPLAGLLPEPHQQVLMNARFLQAGWRRAGITCLSLALGATTHLLWDSFTHATAFFVQAFEWLAWPVPFPGKEIRVYTLLQHGGTLAGVAALTISYCRQCVRISGIHPLDSRPRRLGWLAAVMGSAVTLALPIAYWESISMTGEANLHIWLVRQVAYSTSVFVGLIVSIALVRHWRLTRERVRPASSAR